MRVSRSRFRRRFRAALLCALTLAALVGCGSRRDSHAGPVVAAPVPRPDAVVLEGSVGDFAQLRGALPPDVGATLPESALGLLESSCARLPPTLRERVGSDARAVFAIVRSGTEVGYALAVRVHTDAGATPLGVGTVLGELGADGAPPDGRWIGGVPEANRSGAALVGDVLVCARSAADLRAAAPYLARTLVPASEGDARTATLRPPPEVMGAPLVAHAVTGLVARDVRAWADAKLAETTTDLSASARQALAAHSAPPVLGDPVALVAVLRARLGRLVALLPDVGAVHTTLAPGGGGLVVSLVADVGAGSPLDDALDALPTVEPRSLGALPRGAAVAALFPAEPATTRSEWSFGAGLAEDLARVGGARLSERDGNSVRSALAELGATRGTSLIAVLGRDLAGPFALLASAGAVAAPAPERLTAALGTDYLRAIAGRALGCTGDAAPRPLSRPIDLGGTSLRMLDVCGVNAPMATVEAAARSPRIDHATRGSAWAVAVTQLPSGASAGPLSSIAARAASALSGVDDVGTLAADPDTARAFAALPARAHFALAVVPDQLIAAASLFPVEVLARAASDAGATPPGPPLLLTLARDGDALRLQLVLPTPALARTAESVATAASLSR